MRKIKSKAAIIIIVLLLVACSSPAPAPPIPVISTPAQESTPIQGNTEVLISAREFRPGVITIAVGSTVTWVSQDGEEHTITSATPLFEGSVGPFGSYSYTFTQKGSFDYFCRVWPMGGQVIVK